MALAVPAAPRTRNGKAQVCERSLGDGQHRIQAVKLLAQVHLFGHGDCKSSASTNTS